MNSEQIETLIERYLRGDSLSETERNALTNALGNDPDLAARLRFEDGLYRSLDQNVSNHAVRELRAKQQRKRSTRIIGVATAVLLLLLGLVWLIAQQSPTVPFTPQAGNRLLYAAVGEAESARQIGRSVGDSDWQDDLLSGNAQPARLDSAYTELSRLLSTLTEPCSARREAYFLGLLELYHIGNYDRAAMLFECFPLATTTYPQVPLHLTLANLGMGRVEQARNIISTSGMDTALLPPASREILGQE